QQMHLAEIENKDLDGEAETRIIEIDGEKKSVPLYQTEEKEIYLLNNQKDLEYMVDKQRELGILVRMDENYQFNYDYYLQGYESSKFKNLIQLLNLGSDEELMEGVEKQEIRSLEKEQKKSLTDKENLLPVLLVFNGALMGIFIIAAYIFLDKQEGVIKAYAVSPAPIWQYLFSKMGVVMVTTVVTSFILVLPLMKLEINYLLFLLLLLTSAFFASSLGLVIASFYDNIVQAFGTIYTLMILMLIPTITYFMPSWNFFWVKWIPSYGMLEAFKSILLGVGNNSFILTVNTSFLVIGLALFLYANHRFTENLVN
ncbi:MAG: ABC transporter permease, partial [Atopostipes sp.]|nr:ABC transporter permease [Atopostipes sp.]